MESTSLRKALRNKAVASFAYSARSALCVKECGCFRRMLNIAHEDQKIQVVPKIRLLKSSPARKGLLAKEQFDSLVSFLVTQFRMQMLRSQQRALYASRIRSILSAGGSYLAWASGTTAME